MGIICFVTSAKSWPVGATVMVVYVLVYGCAVVGVSGLPFPAPDMRRCESLEGCCTPVKAGGGAPRKFEFQGALPLRTRPAAQLVDAAYAAKLRRAYALMRALPDSDGRSFANQAKLHCAYCDNALRSAGHAYPLEIHNNWLFLPWHRWYLYFHERILAKLAGDATLALPFWNWDDQSSQRHPGGNVLPALYADPGRASSLYDPDRGACPQPPNVIDFADPFPGCANRSAADQRVLNARIMYTQMVSGPVTPSLFFGQPYRLGDLGGTGAGTLEYRPHNVVHLWMNAKDSSFKVSANDPLFFAHHAAVDRMWEVWKTLPGGVRKELEDPDWLDTEFTFYDEDGELVRVSIGQGLDTALLRYKYQELPAAGWTTAAVEAGEPFKWPLCNPASETEISAMIKRTRALSEGSYILSTEPLTFKVKRPRVRPSGEEVLFFGAIETNWTITALGFSVFLFLPDATAAMSYGCPEFVGNFWSIAHVGMSPQTATSRKWPVSVGPRLREMGRDAASHVVVTLTPNVGNAASPVRVQPPKLVYYDS